MDKQLSLCLEQVRTHLRQELLPYWSARGDDPIFGGFLTYFDREGNPTGESQKNLLAHARMIYSFSAIHRAGLDPEGAFLDRAGRGVRFMLDHFLDWREGGWFWVLERNGRQVDRKKIIYGHSFVIYAFSEYARACGDQPVLELAERTFEWLESFAADNLNGGWYEFFEREWTHCQPGVYGGDRKSFDVHMHLMEAFTNLYAASGREIHARRARETTELLVSRMLHPEHGTAIAQFSPDFKPLRAIIFKNVWGSDREAGDDRGRPLDNTSYGHNVEFAWLLGVTVRTLGLDPARFRAVQHKLYDHCLEFGLDRELGGVFCEGPHRGPARERNKEFWQQAEALTGFLDAWETFGDPRYRDAYLELHSFVFGHVINHRVGEWLPLLGPDNRVLWDYMGHAWKINYHTVRAMLECERRLAALI